jgi:Co/Zn/Cd efflux system component
MSLRKTVLLVASLNFAYFTVEFAYGRILGSIALISDSVDFLEDAAVNVLIAMAVGWSVQRRHRVSVLFAGLLLLPGIAFLWNAVQQLLDPRVPAGDAMSFVGLGALAVNLFCALLVARHRKESGGLVMAAYYSARNDAIANVLIICSGLLTLRVASIWPDFVVGLVIFMLNAGAAREILAASRRDLSEHRA